MKISDILLCALILFSFRSKSQVGFLDSTYTWTEIQYYANGYESIRHTMSSEPTLLNGKNYYEILSSRSEFGGNWDPTWIFLRYEDQKIFAGYENIEFLVFDFSLLPGDTLIENAGPPYRVVAVDTILLENGESRKRLITECVEGAWGDIYIDWIEGLGSSAGIVQYGSICGFDTGSALMCISRNDTLLYTHPEIDSCWITPVSTSDPDFLSISIVPNPVEDEMVVIDPDRLIRHIEIFNGLGMRVCNTTELRFSAQHYAPGIYHILIHLKSGQKTVRKILKM